MSKIIETIFAARSEPQRLKEEAAEEADLLVDDADEIDWQFFGNGRGVLFERKTAHDLINSFLEANEATGEPRVVAQIRRLADASSSDVLACLLAEGHIYNRRGYAYAEGVRRQIPFNAVDNFLLLVQRWGIHVVRSASINHTMARMVSVAESWLSTEDKAPIIMLPKAPVPQIRTLMTFPGVGFKAAKRAVPPGVTLREVLHDLVHNNPSNSVNFGKLTYVKIQKFLDQPLFSRKEGE